MWDRDEHFVAINKPAGIAVQVHRLDRDTSGVLLLARTADAAAAISSVLRDSTAGSVAWTTTVPTAPVLLPFGTGRPADPTADIGSGGVRKTYWYGRGVMRPGVRVALFVKSKCARKISCTKGVRRKRQSLNS
eukprot:1196302-Prorocentrum_minimum.AAC.5